MRRLDGDKTSFTKNMAQTASKKRISELNKAILRDMFSAENESLISTELSVDQNQEVSQEEINVDFKAR